MLIPMDRPIIDARNIAQAKEITINAGNFTIEHDNKPVVLVTLSGSSQTYASNITTAIAAGSIKGQELTVVLVDDGTGNNLVVKDNANTKLKGDWKRGQGDEMWLRLVWNSSDWIEVGRDEGDQHTASGQNAHVEGVNNTASGSYSHVEGHSNSATNGRDHAEGNNCTASGGDSHVQGNGSTASGAVSHAEGNSTDAEGNNTHTQGVQTKATGSASHAEGYRSFASLYCQHAHAAGYFAGDHYAQYTRVLLRKQTTDAAVTELFLDGSAARLIVKDEHTYACAITVCARQDTGVDHGMFKRMVLVERTGGTVLLAGAVQTIGTDINPGGFGAVGGAVQISVDNVNKTLKIEVEGLAGHNIRWLAVVDTVEVGYAD